jgi:hypothetical protein
LAKLLDQYFGPNGTCEEVAVGTVVIFGLRNLRTAIASENRQIFLIMLCKALMKSGAPSHRIEAQLKAVASILDVIGEFVQLPGIICPDEETQTSKTHWVKNLARKFAGST